MIKQKPKHIGIIPDGNRRWASGKGMKKQDGYEHGLMPGLRLLKMAKEKGVEEITYYGFTMDNCKRPKEKCFPKELLPYTKRTPVNGGGIRVNFLVNYGWQWDLSHMQEDGQPYSKDISRMDLIIRWGGMRRLSGFLPLQSVYADFYVEEHLWPEYTDADFLNALAWYEKQDVTLGG